MTYIDAIREAQEKLLREDDRVFLYGQDIATFGGAFKATKGLAEQFPNRVFDAPISEDAMIGMAVGAAIEGMRPIVEMQFADFSSLAFNQIVNQAATHFYRTGMPIPITVRLPSGGTPGSGPFHSQSMEGIYAQYPGLVVLTPATVSDAYHMLLDGGGAGRSGHLLRAQVPLPLAQGEVDQRRPFANRPGADHPARQARHSGGLQRDGP